MIPLGVLAGSRHVPATGGWTPDSIAGLDLWLRGESLTGLAPGDPISSWPDSSPEGNTATQPNGANMPPFSNAKGFPSAWFSGALDHYLATPASASDPSQTAFVVTTVEDGSVRTPLGASATGGLALDFPSRRLRARIWGGGSVVDNRVLPPVGAIMANGGMLDASASSLSAWLGLNPAATVVTNSVPTAGRTLRIGIKGSSAERHHGHIFEVIHYSRALTEPERVGVMGYLLTKYKLT